MENLKLRLVSSGLYRPDGFVAWRAPNTEGWTIDAEEAGKILKIVAGKGVA